METVKKGGGKSCICSSQLFFRPEEDGGKNEAQLKQEKKSDLLYM